MSNKNIKKMEHAVSRFTSDIHKALNSLAMLGDTLQDVKNDPESDTADFVRAEFIRGKAMLVKDALLKVYPKTLTPTTVD